MKKVLLRVAIGLVCLAVLVVALLAGAVWHSRWQYQQKKDRLAREVEAMNRPEDRVVLYSLDPKTWEQKNLPEESKFHGYAIRGSAEILDPAERSRLFTSLGEGIRNVRFVAMCFDPHHGLRIVQGDKTIDLVLCFGCQQGKIHNYPGIKEFSVSGTPWKVFDTALRNHGLPVYEPRPKAGQ